MLKFVYDRATIIAISLSFFTFGFVLAAAVYDLSMREVFTGLIAGAVINEFEHDVFPLSREATLSSMN